MSTPKPAIGSTRRPHRHHRLHTASWRAPAPPGHGADGMHESAHSHQQHLFILIEMKEGIL